MSPISSNPTLKKVMGPSATSPRILKLPLAEGAIDNVSGKGCSGLTSYF